MAPFCFEGEEASEDEFHLTFCLICDHDEDARGVGMANGVIG